MYQDWKVKRMKEVAEYYKEKMVGRRYRHFKGSLYIISEIAINSEDLGIIVIYKDWENPSLTWARPFGEFTSEVDHVKYPNIKQELRFELVSEDEEERK